MLTSQPLFFALILLFALALSVFCLIKLTKLGNNVAQLTAQLSSIELIVADLKAIQLQEQQNTALAQQKLSEWQFEHQQVSQQLEHRSKVQNEKYLELKNIFESFEQQQPADKLYSRAQKMVQLGAGIDEVIQECQLPRAEVEILFSVTKRKS